MFRKFLFLVGVFFPIILISGESFSQALEISKEKVSESASSTEQLKASDEMTLMLDAAGKSTEALSAKLDGDLDTLKIKVSEGVEIYDKVMLKYPTNVKAYNGKGALLDLLEPGKGAAEYKKAIEMTSKSIQANSSDSFAYFNRATAYRGLKMYAEARNDYEQAIRLNPNRFDWPVALRAMNAEANLQ